jgi:hypothetical protein
MSALGQKLPRLLLEGASATPPKADILRCFLDVSKGLEAEMLPVNFVEAQQLASERVTSMNL